MTFPSLTIPNGRLDQQVAQITAQPVNSFLPDNIEISFLFYQGDVFRMEGSDDLDDVFFKLRRAKIGLVEDRGSFLQRIQSRICLFSPIPAEVVQLRLLVSSPATDRSEFRITHERHAQGKFVDP